MKRAGVSSFESLGRGCGIVGHRKGFAAPFIRAQHPLCLFECEWSRAAATEHGDLIARLVDRAIAIKSFRNRECLAFRFVSCDELRLRSRTKASISRHCFRRG